MLTRRRRPFLIRRLREAYFFFANPVKRIYRFFVRPKTRGVKTVALNSGRVLLVRLGYAHRQWTLPGGMVDRGETFEAAAERELFEESGVSAGPVTYFGKYFTLTVGKRDTVKCFYVETDIEDLVIDDQEIVDAAWFPRDQLPEDRWPRVDRVLDMYDTYRNKTV